MSEVCTPEAVAAVLDFPSVAGAATGPQTETAALAARLQDYIGATLGHAVGVSAVRRLAGGASCDTWAFDLDERRGEGVRHLVLRRAFERGLLATDLQAEFALLRKLHELGFPVALPYWCEGSGSPLGSPFLVTQRVAGTDLRKSLAGLAGNLDRRALGVRLTRLQRRIHATDWKTHLGSLVRSPDGALAEVDYWARSFDGGRKVSPLVRAALAWLRTHAPERGEECLLHGDYKANNVLFAADGGLGVLDWEMCHVGDPVEDIAWTLLWTTEWDLVGGLLSPDDYVRAYEEASGRAVEPRRLAYWRLFSWMKLSAIFHTGGGQPDRPMLAMLGRAQPYLDLQLARELSRAVAGSDA